MSSPEYVTRYFNKGDLGLGREMHCVRNGCTRETACYVKNFAGAADGRVLFDQMEQAKTALLANSPFATVAMVERGAMPAGAPNKVFFVAYDNKKLLDARDPESAILLMEAGLDTKGHNKSIPGNCLVCHGTASRYKASSSTSQYDATVTGAYFLPFDLLSFQFFSFDPSNALSKVKQEPAFKGLNQLVYLTDLYLNTDARELLDGWYGGRKWPSATFISGFVPSGWRHPSNATTDANRVQLYRNVVARSCRTCHISHTDSASLVQAGPLTFGKFEDLSSEAVRAYFSVCKSHSMPNAEQALKGFWNSPARSHFLNRLGLPDDCDVQRQDSPPSTLREGATVDTRDLVQRFAVDSCGCTTPACLRKVDGEYLRELGSSAPLRANVDDGITEAFDRAAACRRQVLAPNGSSTSLPASILDDLLEREEAVTERMPRTHSR